MIGIWENLRESIQDAAERNRNRPFLEAAMAACAYIAMADGEVSIGERGRVDDILNHLEALRVFDPHEGVNIFNDHVEALLNDPENGRRGVLSAISNMARDDEAALLVARICIAISNADGEFSANERETVVEVCEVLKATGRISF